MGIKSRDEGVVLSCIVHVIRHTQCSSGLSLHECPYSKWGHLEGKRSQKCQWGSAEEEWVCSLRYHCTEQLNKMSPAWQLIYNFFFNCDHEWGEEDLLFAVTMGDRGGAVLQ